MDGLVESKNINRKIADQQSPYTHAMADIGDQATRIESLRTSFVSVDIVGMKRMGFQSS